MNCICVEITFSYHLSSLLTTKCLNVRYLSYSKRLVIRYATLAKSVSRIIDLRFYWHIFSSDLSERELSGDFILLIYWNDKFNEEDICFKNECDRQ